MLTFGKTAQRAALTVIATRCLRAPHRPVASPISSPLTPPPHTCPPATQAIGDRRSSEFTHTRSLAIKTSQGSTRRLARLAGPGEVPSLPSRSTLYVIVRV